MDKKDNVVDITKYLQRNKDSEKRQLLEKLPSVYMIRVEMHRNKDGVHLNYDVSNKKLRDTELGREIVFEHLMCIMLDLCEDNPELIYELEQSMYDYFFDSEGEE